MNVTRKKMAIACLMLGMFFNPFGYDAIFKMILDATGSYWTTVSVFYLIAGSFFISYFILAKVNPIKEVFGRFLKVVKKFSHWN